MNVLAAKRLTNKFFTKMFFFCGETTKTENREQLGKKRLGIGWGWGR